MNFGGITCLEVATGRTTCGCCRCRTRTMGMDAEDEDAEDAEDEDAEDEDAGDGVRQQQHTPDTN